MFGEMSARAPAVEKSIMAPVPLTERGFNMHLTSTKRGDMFAYTNGRTVFLREINDVTKVRVFAEHKCKATVVKFSPNGRHCASGDVEGNLLIWEILSDRFSLRKSFPINKGIKDISWSPDSKRLAVCGASDGGSFAKAILADSGNTIGDLNGHDATVLSIDFKPNRPFRVASGGEDRTTNFFTGPPFKFTSSYTEHKNYVQCVRFAPDGSQYFSTGNDAKVHLFDGKSGERVRSLKQGKKATKHLATIYSASWSPDSKQLLTASADKTCKIWNVEDNALVSTFKFGEDVKRPAIEDMQISTLWHSPEKLLSLSLSGAINFLDPTNPDSITSVHGCMHSIKSLVADAKNNCVYTGEAGSGVITRWDLNTGLGKWFGGKNSGSAVSQMRLSPDNQLEVITLDDKYRSHDATTLMRADDKKLPAVPVGGATRQLANANHDPTMYAIVLAQGKVVVFKDSKIASSTVLPFEPYCICFSHDDSHLYIGGKNKAVQAFTIDAAGTTVTPTETKYDCHDVCTHVTVTPDGKWMCAADKRRSLNMFDLSTGALLNSADPLRYHLATVKSVEYSPNGSKLLSAGADSLVYIWYEGAVEGKCLKIEAHTQSVAHATWLDEETIVTCSDDLTIKTWTIPQAYVAE